VPPALELRLATREHVESAAAVNGSVEVTVLALVLTSRVVSVFAAPFVRSLAVTWKIAEFAVGTTASCLVALDKSDASVGQTDWRLLTMLNAARAPVESVAPTTTELDDAALDDAAGAVTTMVSVPRGTVGVVTSPPPVADCPADTGWLESTVAATCASAPELAKTA